MTSHTSKSWLPIIHHLAFPNAATTCICISQRVKCECRTQRTNKQRQYGRHHLKKEKPTTTNKTQPSRNEEKLQNENRDWREKLVHQAAGPATDLALGGGTCLSVGNGRGVTRRCRRLRPATALRRPHRCLPPGRRRRRAAAHLPPAPNTRHKHSQTSTSMYLLGDPVFFFGFSLSGSGLG